MMNAWLREDNESRRRDLSIRSYRVIPLTPDRGVMEFVDKTKPLLSVLVSQQSVGEKGLHEKYYPGDYTHSECRRRLKEADDTYNVFQDIMDRFHPVFRYFFLENFPEPAQWYHRRLHYTQSAAVSSIVGYLLGIGDRHASNILVDQRTGRLVHIDFGYAFEQGKVLPRPETVPFRLTRDIVDAMGITGTEGSFRTCCDVTMTLLREKGASLLTILDVLLHDPLHKWLAFIPEEEGGEEEGGEESRARRRNVKRTEAPQQEAERTLLRIRQKLQGYEDPNGDAMSVEGHVKYLITEARDPANLCRVFFGWSPWL